jgi:GNAT superfamily N-acetyltransferase
MTPADDPLLEQLDALVRQPYVMARLDPIADRVEHKLAADPTASMAWEPVPLEIYGTALPDGMRSSWVFVLRGNGTNTGPERHPNSHQRMASYRRNGDMQTRQGDRWQSHLLESDLGAPLSRRWISIPPYVWHQVVTVGPDWTVVSFQTVPAEELIEERPETTNWTLTSQKHYVAGPDSILIESVDVCDPAAQLLISHLSAELDRIYGAVGDGNFPIEEFVRLGGVFLVGRLNGRPVACGAIRPVEPAVAEVKRMYVEPDLRGRGFGRRILAELEARARLAGYTVLRLETGDKQPEAIRLYETAGYHRIERYGIYRDNVHSICFQKELG